MAGAGTIAPLHRPVRASRCWRASRGSPLATGQRRRPRRGGLQPLQPRCQGGVLGLQSLLLHRLLLHLLHRGLLVRILGVLLLQHRL